LIGNLGPGVIYLRFITYMFDVFNIVIVLSQCATLKDSEIALLEN
jgi:hypothetical protein